MYNSWLIHKILCYFVCNYLCPNIIFCTYSFNFYLNYSLTWHWQVSLIHMHVFTISGFILDQKEACILVRNLPENFSRKNWPIQLSQKMWNVLKRMQSRIRLFQFLCLTKFSIATSDLGNNKTESKQHSYKTTKPRAYDWLFFTENSKKK